MKPHRLLLAASLAAPTLPAPFAHAASEPFTVGPVTILELERTFTQTNVRYTETNAESPSLVFGPNLSRPEPGLITQTQTFEDTSAAFDSTTSGFSNFQALGAESFTDSTGTATLSGSFTPLSDISVVQLTVDEAASGTGYFAQGPDGPLTTVSDDDRFVLRDAAYFSLRGSSVEQAVVVADDDRAIVTAAAEEAAGLDQELGTFTRLILTVRADQDVFLLSDGDGGGDSDSFFSLSRNFGDFRVTNSDPDRESFNLDLVPGQLLIPAGTTETLEITVRSEAGGTRPSVFFPTIGTGASSTSTSFNLDLNFVAVNPTAITPVNPTPNPIPTPSAVAAGLLGLATLGRRRRTRG